MIKFGFVFLVTFFKVYLISGQNPLVKQWDYRFGGTNQDNFYSFKQTFDGGFILGGTSNSGIGGDKTQPSWLGYYDYWIVKTDSLGFKQWDKRFGGTFNDYFQAIQQTADGGYIIGGYTGSDSSGDKTQPLVGDYDYWVVKTDSLGNKEWDKNFGGSDNDLLYCLIQTNDGGYMLGGYTLSPVSGDKTQANWGGSDFWIIKIDSLGNKQWDRILGGMGFEYCRSILQTAEGDYVFGGISGTSFVLIGEKSQNSWGDFDYWIIKTDSMGNKLWDKDFGGTGEDRLFSLQQTFDKGFILGGFSGSGVGGNKTQPLKGGAYHDYWILKVDSMGNKQWDKDFGGTGEEKDFGIISQTADSGFLVSGSSYSNLSGDKTADNLGNKQTWILKTDTGGVIQWDKTLLSTVHSESGAALQTRDGCYAIVCQDNGAIGGDKTQEAWNFSTDYWIYKCCDTTQTVLPPEIKVMSNDSSICQNSCVNFTDISANIPTSWQWYFPGATPDTSTQKNPFSICYNNPGNYDVILVACNHLGCDSLNLSDFIKVYQTTPPTITISHDTLFCSAAFFYAWHEISDSLNILSSDSFFVITQNGNYFVITTDSNGCDMLSNVLVYNTGLTQFADDENSWVSFYPNPASTMIYFVFRKPNVNAKLQILNLPGECVHQATFNNQQSSVNISAVPDGIYFLKVTIDDKQFIRKIIVRH